MAYRHTPEMGEISGFGERGDPGGIAYEKCCQDMLEAGVLWITAHPNAQLEMMHSPNMTGVFSMTTPDGEDLEKAILAASLGEPDEEGHRHHEATGAQMHTVMMRLMFIAANGWDKYCEELSKPEENPDA